MAVRTSSPDPRHGRLGRLLARQHQVVTRSQVTELGFSDTTFTRWCAEGRFDVLHRGVAIVASAPRTIPARAFGAVLAAGGRATGAAASHTTAAALFGHGPGSDLALHVTRTRAGSHVAPDGVIVHRPRTPGDRPVVRVDGVPCTSPVQTLLDLGAVADVEVVHSALAHLVQRRLVTPAALQAALARSGRGRAGTRAVRAALAAYSPETAHPESVLEAAFDRLLRAAGLPLGRAQVRVGPYRVDRLLPHRVVVELDGAAHHLARFEQDRARDAALAARGYLVLRFTWRQVMEEPEAVAALIARTLAQRASIPA